MLITAKKYQKNALVFAAILVLTLFMSNAAHAQTALQITDSTVKSVLDTKATLGWTTNFPSTGRIDFGTDPGYGTYLILGSQPDYDHEITLTNLTPETTYHYSVTAFIGDRSVTTFDRTFKTQKYIDTTIPVISNVHVAYVTATQATIQWQTNEDANSTVRYGTSSYYTNTTGNGTRTKIHDITIGNLRYGTTYHFQVSSADSASNTATYTDNMFTTLYNAALEQSPLTISDVRPLTVNDSQLGTDWITISWSTNKLASGRVNYGVYTWLGNGQWQSSPFRTFEHSAVITGLKPNTVYYFTLQSWDVFGKYVGSDTYSFRTRAVAAPPQVQTPTATQILVSRLVPVKEKVLVLGFTTLDTTAAKALYRITGQKDVYAIMAGQRYRVQGLPALQTYARGLTITDVSKEKMESYPLLRLVKPSGGNTVYYLYRRSNNVIIKLALPTAAIFTSYPSNRWSDIATLDTNELLQYPNARLVKAEGSAAIYLLDNGMKRLIPSESLFRARGFSFSDVVEISPEHLDYFKTGSALQ